MKDFDQQLLKLRDQIDEIDQQLVELLAKRREVTSKVGKLKVKLVNLSLMRKEKPH